MESYKKYLSDVTSQASNTNKNVLVTSNWHLSWNIKNFLSVFKALIRNINYQIKSIDF